MENISIGSIISITRKQKHLSQKKLCENICSQSMLSAIESDKYSPNSNLLIALCKRLSISLDTFNLANNFEISQITDFNKTVEELCNTHKYLELKTFLNKDIIVDSLKTDTQLQAYYYYLGISKFQTEENHTGAIRDIKLSLACAPETNNKTTLTRLGIISLSLITTSFKESENLVQQALNQLETLNYEQNQNIIFYLASLNFYRRKNYLNAFNYLQKAIDFITKHNSHYMLANCYYLLAHISDKSSDTSKKIEALSRQKIFTDLFDEKVYRDI